MPHYAIECADKIHLHAVIVRLALDEPVNLTGSPIENLHVNTTVPSEAREPRVVAKRFFVGYDNLLKILKNRKHPEYKSMKEWLGRAFDAASFDVGKTNLWLRKLKWPRVTEAQLRKVLMGRDDYQE